LIGCVAHARGAFGRAVIEQELRKAGGSISDVSVALGAAWGGAGPGMSQCLRAGWRSL
jgi:hypothetical protein